MSIVYIGTGSNLGKAVEKDVGMAETTKREAWIPAFAGMTKKFWRPSLLLIVEDCLFCVKCCNKDLFILVLAFDSLFVPLYLLMSLLLHIIPVIPVKLELFLWRQAYM